MEPRGVGRPTPAASTSRSCGSLSGAPGGWRGSARRSRSISKRPCYGVPGAGSKRSSRRGRGSYRLATTGGPDSSGPRRRRRGGWTAPVARMLGIRLPVVGSVLQVVVTESRPAVLPQLVQPIARRLTLKQDDGRDLPDRRRLAGRVRSADPVRHHAPRPHRPQRLGRRANRTRARGACAWSLRGRQHGRLAADPRGGGGAPGRAGLRPPARRVPPDRCHDAPDYAFQPRAVPIVTVRRETRCRRREPRPGCPRDPAQPASGHQPVRIASAMSATGTEPCPRSASWKRPSSKPGRVESSRRSRWMESVPIR